MISYEQKEKKFNFRVGGILESPDRKKVLIHRLSNFNFWLLPGGRVEMLEDTENAILREIQECQKGRSKMAIFLKNCHFAPSLLAHFGHLLLLLIFFMEYTLK